MWRLLQLVAGGGILVVLGGGALMVWPLLWPADPDTFVQLVNGRLVGETTGYVGHIDRDARTVDVSASLFGWRPVVLVVSESTAILVHDRRGGFGDLGKDMPVRVSYEVVGDQRLARSIEVVSGNDRASPGVVSGATTPALVAPAVDTPPAIGFTPPVDSAAPAGAADPGPIPPAPEPPPASVVATPPPQPPPAQPSPVPEPSRRDEQPRAKPAAVPESPRPAEMAPAKPSPPPDPPRSVGVRPAKPSPAAPAPPGREAPAARSPRLEPAPASPGRSSSPADTETGDGAAAIDWLLKGSRP